jgi:hypothetical protein
MAAGTRIMAGLAIASAAALVVAVIFVSEPDPPMTAAPPDVVRIGLLEGQSVRGYLDSARDELSALDASGRVTDTWALVSLGGYVPPDRLAPLLDGVAVAQVYARAPVAGTPTPVVRIPAARIPDDVVAGMRATAALRDQESADYRQLMRRVTGDTPSDARLRSAYATAAQVAGAEAGAYRSACACVFGAVVRAAPAALTVVASRTGVRAVDPAPELTSLDGVEFDPPLPEQVAGPEPSGPPSAPVAPATATPVPSSLGARDVADPPGPGRTGRAPSDASSPAASLVPSVPAPSSVPASEERASEPSAPKPATTAGASGR